MAAEALDSGQWTPYGGGCRGVGVVLYCHLSLSEQAKKYLVYRNIWYDTYCAVCCVCTTYFVMLSHHLMALAHPPSHSIETISIDTIKYRTGAQSIVKQQTSKYKQNKIIFQSNAGRPQRYNKFLLQHWNITCRMEQRNNQPLSPSLIRILRLQLGWSATFDL